MNFQTFQQVGARKEYADAGNKRTDQVNQSCFKDGIGIPQHKIINQQYG
jgi:hypothetical protein